MTRMIHADNIAPTSNEVASDIQRYTQAEHGDAEHPHSVITVARYLLEECQRRHQRTDEHMLYILCYYAQAWNLVATDRPLFREPIVARADGPYIPALYAVIHPSQEMTGSGHWYNMRRHIRLRKAQVLRRRTVQATRRRSTTND